MEKEGRRVRDQHCSRSLRRSAYFLVTVALRGLGTFNVPILQTKKGRCGEVQVTWWSRVGEPGFGPRPGLLFLEGDTSGLPHPLTGLVPAGTG